MSGILAKFKDKSVAFNHFFTTFNLKKHDDTQLSQKSIWNACDVAKLSHLHCCFYVTSRSSKTKLHELLETCFTMH